MITHSRILLFFLLAVLPPLSFAQEEEKPQVVAPLIGAVPAGAFAFAETSQLGDLIASIKTSGTYQTLIESDQYKEFQATNEYEEFQDALGLVEFILRTDLWEAGEKLFGGRAGLALYPKKGSKKPDFVFLLRPADPSVWNKQRIWTDPLLWLAADRVDKKRFSWGLKVYQLEGDNPVFFALHKEWVAVSTSMEVLEKTISLQIKDPKERTRRKLKKTKPLELDTAFKAMAKMVGDNHLARALVDIKTISKGTDDRLGIPKKMDNPLGSLLAGGILELAAHSKYGTATVDADESGFVLEVGFDGDPKKLDERFQVFFNDHPKSGTQALPEVPGLIGGFTVYRDIATWYRSRDDLLVEEVLPEFDKFESGVGNLLPGKDIGEDVLPLLGGTSPL